MDGIFDRLTNLIRSLVQDGYEDDTASDRTRFGDPDLQDAWEELDEYMSAGKDGAASDGRQTNGTGTGGSARSRGSAQSGGSGRRSSTSRASAGAHDPKDELRKDYKNLEVPFNAPFDEVKRAYKRLLVTYHPDKHSGDPEKLRIATEITKKVNYSFQRIKKFQETGSW